MREHNDKAHKRLMWEKKTGTVGAGNVCPGSLGSLGPFDCGGA
jgi:hypothetical protein